MPVRAIKRISIQHAEPAPIIVINVPQSILNAFRQEISGHLTFVCEFKGHYDKDRTLIRNINETVKIPSFSGEPLVLTDRPITQKYGFVVGEYVEVIFHSIEVTLSKEGIFGRVKEDTISKPIFPERMFEDLDFSPG